MTLEKIKVTGVSLIAVIVAFIYLFCFVWLIKVAVFGTTSFQPTVKYFHLILGRPEFYTALKNSFIISGGTALIQVPFALLGGYALARFRRSKLVEICNIVFPITLLIPWVAILAPTLIYFVQLDIYDTRIGLVLHHAAFSVPFVAWMIARFVENIPVEVEEAALLDGCSRPRVIISIILPLSAMGILAIAMWVFVNVWNTYIVALMLTSSVELRVLPLLLYGWLYQTGNYPGLSTTAILLLIPPLLLFFGLRNWFIRGFAGMRRM